MKNLGLLATLIVCLTGCGRLYTTKAFNETERVVLQCSKNYEKNYGCSILGWGGPFGSKVTNMMVDYEMPCVDMDVNTARRIAVDGIDNLLRGVNTDMDIRKYMEKHPFTIDDIYYSMDFLKECSKGEYLEVGNVSLILGEKLVYVFWDQEKECLKKVHEETYDQASKILQKEMLCE